MPHFIVVNETPDQTEEIFFFKEINEALSAAGFTAECWSQLDRTTITLCGEVEIEVALQIIKDDLALKVEDWWHSPEPSGRNLHVNLYYPDESQVVSAQIDEGQLVGALWSCGGDEERRRRTLYAVTSLASDNEFPAGYGFFDGSMAIELQDIMEEVSFWYDWDALLRNPNPDDTRPRVEFTFQPKAKLPDGSLVDIVVDGLDTSFSLPENLISKDLDVQNAEQMASLLRLGAVPHALREFAKIMPYELTVTYPDAQLENDADTPAP